MWVSHWIIASLCVTWLLLATSPGRVASNTCEDGVKWALSRQKTLANGVVKLIPLGDACETHWLFWHSNFKHSYTWLEFAKAFQTNPQLQSYVAQAQSIEANPTLKTFPNQTVDEVRTSRVVISRTLIVCNAAEFKKLMDIKRAPSKLKLNGVLVMRVPVEDGSGDLEDVWRFKDDGSFPEMRRARLESCFEVARASSLLTADKQIWEHQARDCAKAAVKQRRQESGEADILAKCVLTLDQYVAKHREQELHSSAASAQQPDHASQAVVEALSDDEVLVGAIVGAASSAAPPQPAVTTPLRRGRTFDSAGDPLQSPRSGADASTTHDLDPGAGICVHMFESHRVCVSVVWRSCKHCCQFWFFGSVGCWRVPSTGASQVNAYIPS